MVLQSMGLVFELGRLGLGGAGEQDGGVLVHGALQQQVGEVLARGAGVADDDGSSRLSVVEPLM